MFKIQIKARQKCAARRVASSSSSIIHRLSLRVDPVCLDMEKAQQASERGLSVARREGKVKRINNAIIVQCQNEILFNEASLKICQKSRAHQSGPVPCREVCVVGWLVRAWGEKPKAVSRYALISISRIIRHRLRLHLARGITIIIIIIIIIIVRRCRCRCRLFTWGIIDGIDV